MRNSLSQQVNIYMICLRCVLYAYVQLKEKSTGAKDFHRGRHLQEDSNVIPTMYICVTINFIDTWINTLYKNISWRCLVYKDKTK